VFFQRFILVEQQYIPDVWDLFILGTASLFLSGKVEDTPKRMQDVIVTAYHTQYENHLKEQEFHEIVKKIVRCEIYLMSSFDFDFSIEHPFIHILDLVKRSKQIELVQKAWQLMNECLSNTCVFLFYPPQLIAAATVAHAAYTTNSSLSDEWWEKLENHDQIEEIIEIFKVQHEIKKKEDPFPPIFK